MQQEAEGQEQMVLKISCNINKLDMHPHSVFIYKAPAKTATHSSIKKNERTKNKPSTDPTICDHPPAQKYRETKQNSTCDSLLSKIANKKE